MRGLGIAITVFGLFIVWAGISLLRNADGAAMPLLLRGVHQQTSKVMGTAFLFVGGAFAILGIVFIITGG